MKITASKLTVLSKGSNSTIYEYTKNSLKVVLKTVPNSCSKEAKHLRNQYEILKGLKHQGIIKVNILESDEEAKQPEDQIPNKSSVLVLEHATHGSLLNFFQKNKLKLPQIRSLLLDVAKAVQFLHCNYFVHRDIKLDNILVTQEKSRITVKLADFGFATNFYENGDLKMFSSLKGTRRGYMAPQIHQTANQLGQSQEKYYDARKSDVFALGVVFFCLVFGMLPFEYAVKNNKIYRNIVQQRFDLFWSSHMKQLSRLQLVDHSMIQQFQDLFEGMVCYNPKNRFSIEEVIRHPWFLGVKTTIFVPKQSKQTQIQQLK